MGVQTCFIFLSNQNKDFENVSEICMEIVLGIGIGLKQMRGVIFVCGICGQEDGESG